MRFTLFDHAKPALAQLGVNVRTGETWQQTRERLLRETRAQLKRSDLKPATVVKWHRLGAIVGAGR